MTTSIYDAIVCECGHQGRIRCRENDAPYSSLWESYSLRRHARVAWVAAAKETGNLALYDLLIERFSAITEAADARGIVAKLRPAQFAEPATISAF